ncbi:MAG: hypothetical protein ACP5E7_01030 [Hydrogenobaculum sp.]
MSSGSFSLKSVFKPAYLLYLAAFITTVFLGIILFGEKLLIARYIMAKNGYYVYYKKAKEYITSIDLNNVKIFYKDPKSPSTNFQYLAHLSYVGIGFYPPFILNASFTCQNGYVDLRENMLLKHIYISSKRFPLSCIKVSKSQGQMDSKMILTPTYVDGFMDFKMLNIKGYYIKSLKLNFKKTHFTFEGEANIFNTTVNVKGNGIVSIDQNTLTNSKISGVGLINLPFKRMRLVFGGTVVNPIINIE